MSLVAKLLSASHVAIDLQVSSKKRLFEQAARFCPRWVAATGNPLVVPDVSKDVQWSAFSRAHPELRIHSLACIPIRSGDRTLGVIQLFNSKLDLMIQEAADTTSELDSVREILKRLIQERYPMGGLDGQAG